MRYRTLPTATSNMVAIVAADDAAWRRRAAIQEAAAAELLPEEAVDLDLPADPSVLDDLEPAEANVALQKPRAVPASRLDAVGRKSKPRPKQPDWRRKFREEIVKLRGEAVTLSATVENLKAAVRDRSEVLDKPGRGPPSAAMLWKRIAARQLTCRAQLESENVRLKADVKQRQKEMRELRRMLLKRANIQVCLLCCALSTVHMVITVKLCMSAGDSRAAGQWFILAVVVGPCGGRRGR